jgi:hypothetical protein
MNHFHPSPLSVVDRHFAVLARFVNEAALDPSAGVVPDVHNMTGAQPELVVKLPKAGQVVGVLQPQVMVERQVDMGADIQDTESIGMAREEEACLRIKTLLAGVVEEPPVTRHLQLGSLKRPHDGAPQPTVHKD